MDDPFKMRTRKKYCVMVQTNFREEESQHLYSDCAYHPEPEPECFTNGVGLHYPEIREKEMSPECDSVCYEKEELPWYLSTMNKIPSYMTKVVSSKSQKKLELVFPHRNKPPFQTPNKRTMAEQYVILEPFQTLSYQGHSLSFALAMAGDPSLSVSHSLEEQLGYCRWYTVTASKGLEYLESCLSFESILDKLETGGGDPSESRSRAVALRLLLRLPAQPPGELEGPPTTSGRLHSRVHLSAKGKHHRVLTPRCDTTIIQQLGRKSAIVLLQKFLRGRAKQMSMTKTKARWEESYDELNGFDQCYKPEGMQCGIDLDISITKRVLVRAFVGQILGAMFEPLVNKSGVPSSPPLTGTTK
ncbi:hypothetical protein AXG93_4295s1640 [Marchantia polymorpha subsp. ruderalis]|uniref:Uncharacterized protein n=1 Tax=Marchantia polymorpha subsp. ruderalis TaxID=1480154 RepID=A0A176WAK9_MARPO|nr:hypothetical protein AXG93_4295s1640 [Marchantia polymorpha subsp. ruderalis]